MELPFAESWKIKMVEPIKKSTREEREKWIKEDESENYVYLEYIDDQQIQVGVTYNSHGMRDIYILV